MSDIKFSWASELSGQIANVYMDHDYQCMLAKNDGSEARRLKLWLRDQTACIPLLLRDIGFGRKEAYSAYGYGGLLGQLSLTETDVTAMCNFLADQSVVAAFIRHSPFMGNQCFWPEGRVELNRQTYSVALQPAWDSFEAYLKKTSQKLRWSVNFARRAGLSVSFHPLSECSESRIKAFYQLYADLMIEKQTSGYYMFSELFFLEHASMLGSRCELAEIFDPGSGNLIAAAFFLLDKNGTVHYHLSSAKRDAMKLQGMELLMASAIHRYGNQGFSSLHLGGGHCLDESDGLSRFKIKFSSERLDFCCTRLVCDDKEYQHERARMPLKNSALFLISDARGQ